MTAVKSALPVVLDLAGRLVVAVGGGPVSARRVRAFLDEGAVVRLVSPWVCEDLGDLVRAGGASGPEGADGGAPRVEWLERDYAGPRDLDGAWFVHTATGEPSVDREVAADAQALRLWCVDATDAAATTASIPARGDVTTPDGRVTYAAYAAGDPRLAVSVRDGVRDAVARGAIDLRRRRTAGRAGWVALVGGGPGADGLLTARGYELLSSADVVVVDRLAPHGVLADLPESVRVIDVGKTPGHHAVPQWRINEILVEEAGRGLGVVRLKGGDPYVLGRGGEERLACEAAGVRVEVVPGVTSAVSVPAAAGIPVTHRGVARGFTVVTGHEDIPSLPTGGDHTLVLLMGLTTLARSMELLVGHGRSADCPVAVVERGYQDTQRTTVGTVATIAARAAAVGAQAPAVVVVGDVVRLGPAWAASRTQAEGDGDGIASGAG